MRHLSGFESLLPVIHDQAEIIRDRAHPGSADPGMRIFQHLTRPRGRVRPQGRSGMFLNALFEPKYPRGYIGRHRARALAGAFLVAALLRRVG
jgi:hypothetical protein